MDTFFVSHGPPSMAIEESLPGRNFLKSWEDNNLVPQKPKSILLISAHWDTSEPSVNIIDGPNETIYDFYGFPSSLYQFKYPAPGAPELAKRVKELLMSKGGFQHVREDKKRGLDHGAWTPLMLMYPKADIPVCQLSIQSKNDGSYHYNMGRALSPLREEGVLIVGSGSATHNSRVPMITDGSVAPWAMEFTTWLTESLRNGRHEDVNNYDSKAPHGKKAHPWPDHFYPLHVALGAAGPTSKAELVHQSWQYGSLSYASYRFSTI
ncbi:hypothetical protein MKX03_009651 [Papaver bracteatum]|nr:hypothetical protein MKX03_009651 [Papaver bracteatum]